jgi:hypothetical protein
VTGAPAEIERELRALVQEGVRLASAIADGNGGDEHAAYQVFYTKALAALRVLAPDRYDEFVSYYEDPDRRHMSRLTYGVCAFCTERVPGSADRKVVASERILVQAYILQAAVERARSLLANIRSTLQAGVLNEDLDAARQLLKSKHVRSAGAVAGVVLERHLASVATGHEIALKKRSPTIADLNDPLRDAGVYDTVQWRFVQRLGDIRNLAVHSKDREPSAEEVGELIDGADKILKTVS